MIKLTLPDKPSKLAREESALTKEFKESGKKKAVWKKEYITRPLLEMSHNKCAYSELKINQKSTYMEVEHFKHKDKYCDDVVNWNNLLPSCKKCNTSKGDLDVIATPIVNPVFDNPRDHLYVCCFRFYGKDAKGGNTINAVALNDALHFVKPRFESSQVVVQELESNFISLKETSKEIVKKRSISAIKTTLASCGPEAEFSAVIATHLLYECPLFGEIREYLETHGYWDDEFEELIEVLEFIALPK